MNSSHKTYYSTKKVFVFEIQNVANVSAENGLKQLDEFSFDFKTGIFKV